MIVSSLHNLTLSKLSGSSLASSEQNNFTMSFLSSKLKTLQIVVQVLKYDSKESNLFDLFQST